MLGCTGAIAVAAGWGVVEAADTTQAAGVRAIVGVGAAWAVASAVVRRGTVPRAIVAGLGSLLLFVTLAPNMGRALGLAAAISIITADHVLRAPGRRSRSSVVAALALVGVAQVALARFGVVALLVGDAAALVVASLDRVAPRVGTALDAAVIRVVSVSRDRGRRTIRSGRDGIVATWGLLWRSGAVMSRSTHLLRRNRPAVVVGTVWILASVPVTWHAIQVAGDYAVHLDYAERSQLLPPWSPAPHPAFHLSVALLEPALGLEGATVAVMAAGAAATGLALLWVGHRDLSSGPGLGGLAAAVYSISYLVVETPATLVVWLGIGPPESGAPALHVFTNPTDTLAVPFALVLTVAVAQWLDATSVSTRHCAVVTGFALVSMVVKPSTGLVLLVAVPLHLAVTRAGSDRWRRAGAWFVAPVFAVAALQTWWVEERLVDAETSGILVRPWRTVELLGLDRAGPLLFAVVLVVPVALWAGRSRYLREPVVAVSLWCFVVGLVALLVLAEAGARAADGTFAKPGLMATIVLCLVSWRFLAGEAVVAVAAVRRGAGIPAWLVAAGVLLLFSLGSGVLVYLDAVGVVTPRFRSPG